MKQTLDNGFKKRMLKNLSATHQRISRACGVAGRDIADVRLMLVTKTISAETINEALEKGERLIGENLSRELGYKLEQLSSHHLPEIHFIGNLHDDELDAILCRVDCIQTVDQYLQASEMNQKLLDLGKEMDILIQVNTSRRDSPYGISPAHTIGLVLQIARLSNLHIKGLMTLGVFDTTEDIARNCFRLLRNLFDEIVELDIPGVSMEVLSMGMSEHLEAAIEEGSTLVRVGTAIFGERETPDSYYWKA